MYMYIVKFSYCRLQTYTVASLLSFIDFLFVFLTYRCLLQNCIVCSNCHIEDRAVLKDCIIGADMTIVKDGELSNQFLLTSSSSPFSFFFFFFFFFSLSLSLPLSLSLSLSIQLTTAVRFWRRRMN